MAIDALLDSQRGELQAPVEQFEQPNDRSHIDAFDVGQESRRLKSLFVLGMTGGDYHSLQQNHIMQRVAQLAPVVGLILDLFKFVEQVSDVVDAPEVLVQQLLMLEEPSVKKLNSVVALL